MGIWASLWTSSRSVPCSRRGCTRSKRIPRNKLSADGVFRYERTAFPPQGRAVSPCGSWETAQEPSPMRAHSHAAGSIMNRAAFRTPPCAGGYVMQLASRICGFQSRSLGYTKGFPVPVLRSLFSNRLHLRPPTHVCRLAVCGKLYFRVPKRIRTGRTCSREHMLFYSQNIFTININII